MDVSEQSTEVSTDEGILHFKGHLSFKQYMPAKPFAKYGIKIW